MIIITGFTTKLLKWLRRHQTQANQGVRMTLWELSLKDSAVLNGFHAETPDRYRGRLCDLGFDQGELVTCMRITPFGGPRVYQIGDGVFSVDRDLAKQILIQVEER